MASDGIGILHLQGIKIRVGFQLFYSLTLQGDVCVVFHHLCVEFFTISFRECWCLTLQSIHEQHNLHFHLIVIRESQSSFYKAETILFTFTSDSYDTSHISIGNKVHLWLFLCPIIVVLRYHQHIATLQFFFSPKNPSSDAIVIDIGSFIGTTNHNGFFYAIMVVTIGYGFYQFISRNHTNIYKSFKSELWQHVKLPSHDKFTQLCSIP